VTDEVRCVRCRVSIASLPKSSGFTRLHLQVLLDEPVSRGAEPPHAGDGGRVGSSGGSRRAFARRA